MQFWPCLVFVLYVKIQHARTVGVPHAVSKRAHDDHAHLGSHHGSHSHDLHRGYHDDVGRSYGGYGGIGSGGHKYGGARGALDSFFSEQHNRGLVARDRGFGYEKAYAYDKQVALKDIGAKKSGYKGIQRAKGSIVHKTIDSETVTGDGKLGTASSSKDANVDGSYSAHDFEKDFSDDFYTPRFLSRPGHRPSYSYYH